jgi:hypothetical protein
MPSRKKKSEPAAQEGQREIVLSPLFELKDPRYKVRYAEMSEEEMKQAARQLAELCLDAYEREHGPLPPPPSDKEFHRLWNKYLTQKENAEK